MSQHLATQSLEESNDLEDADNDLYYPVLDDNNETPSQSPSLNGSSGNTTQGKSDNALALVRAMKQVFLDAGYNAEDMQRILRNSSVFTDDFASRNTSEQAEPDNNDPYSLSAYKENVRKILKIKQGNPDQINLELSQLMRVIIDIELDDLTETLRITENFHQDFPENRTLLISMIQAAVEQWGRNYTKLPPPFGLADENDRISYPPELRYELFNLSRLLTKDLQDQLISILEIDQTKGFPIFIYIHSLFALPNASLLKCCDNRQKTSGSRTGNNRRNRTGNNR